MFSGSCGCVCLEDVQRLLLRHQLFAADECKMQWLPSSVPGATPFLAPCGAVDYGVCNTCSAANGAACASGTCNSISRLHWSRRRQVRGAT